MELNVCAIADQCQTGQRLTLEETIFSFARDDLGLTDVVVSCFEAPSMQGTATRPVFSALHKKCHKIVLAAKSRSLRALLKQHEYLDDVRLVFAGAFDASHVDRFFTEIYRGEDGVELWSLDDDLPEPKVKLEATQDTDKGSTVVRSKKHIRPKRKLKKSYLEFIDDSPVHDYDSDSSSSSPHNFSNEQTSNTRRKKKPLTAKRMRELVECGAKNVESRAGEDDNFHFLYHSGQRTDFLRCLVCSKVLGNNAPAIRRHASSCCRSGSDVGGSSTRRREEGFAINSFYLARQIKQSAPNVELVSPSEASQRVDYDDRQDHFRSIKVDGAVVHFVYCLDCHCVLSYDKRPGGSKALAGHDCKSRLKSADSVIGSKVAREVIEGLVFNKDPEISYGPFRESGCSNLLRRILHNERKMPYCFCKICRDIVADDELENHECFTALVEVANINAQQPNRLTIVEREVVSKMYPFLKPVLLDGMPTGLVMCTSCHKFLRAEGVRREERFSHRCFLGSKDERRQRRESCRSTNLVRVNNPPNGFKCTLCEAVLTGNRAEVHMRTVHGEEGGKVLCSYCGKEFSRLSKARQHELHVHELSRNAVQKFQCAHCPLSFKMQSLLKRHMIGKHSGQTPFVCDVCGKAFKWNATLKAHVLIHQEKKVSCEFCEKKFISRGTYLHHRMTHTGEKPHVCPVCNMGFIKITACKIHAKRHHGVIIPKGISPKVFIEKKMLNKHPEEPGMPQTQQQLQILTNGNEDILMAGPVPTATISPMPQ